MSWHLPFGGHEIYAGLIAATSKSSSGSSATSFLFIIVIFGLGAYLLTGPQRRRRRQQQELQRQVDIGDEIATSSGIIGTVRSFRDDRVRVEVAPGTTIEVLRHAIGRRLDPAPPAEPDELFPGSDNGGTSDGSGGDGTGPDIAGAGESGSGS